MYAKSNIFFLNYLPSEKLPLSKEWYSLSFIEIHASLQSGVGGGNTSTSVVSFIIWLEWEDGTGELRANVSFNAATRSITSNWTISHDSQNPKLQRSNRVLIKMNSFCLNESMKSRTAKKNRAIAVVPKNTLQKIHQARPTTTYEHPITNIRS